MSSPSSGRHLVHDEKPADLIYAATERRRCSDAVVAALQHVLVIAVNLVSSAAARTSGRTVDRRGTTLLRIGMVALAVGLCAGDSARTDRVHYLAPMSTRALTSSPVCLPSEIAECRCSGHDDVAGLAPLVLPRMDRLRRSFRRDGRTVVFLVERRSRCGLAPSASKR